MFRKTPPTSTAKREVSAVLLNDAYSCTISNRIRSKDRYILFFILSLAVLSAAWFVGLVLNPNGLQRAVFFRNTNDWFMDFYNTIYYSIDLQPYSWGSLTNRNYLPLTYVLLYPFTLLYDEYNVEVWDTTYRARYDQLMANFGGLYLILSYALCFYALYRSLKRSRIKETSCLMILGCILLSGISLFSLDRANTVILTSALLFFFLLTYQSPNRLHRYLGCVCLSFAGVLKITPAFFGVLLLYDKKWKEVGVCLLSGVLLAVLPFLLLQGTFIDNVMGYVESLRRHAVVYSNGIFGINAPTLLNVSLSLPSWIAYLMLGISLIVCAYFIRNNRAKAFLLLVLAINMFSGQQAYYSFLYLFFPLTLFLGSAHKKADRLWLLFYVLVLNPFQYSYVSGVWNVTNFTLQNTLYCIAWIVLLVEASIGTIQDTLRYHTTRKVSE